MFKQIVIASDNAGKLREFRQLFEPLGIELLSQRDVGVDPAEEPYCTFVENALTKARHAAAHTGLPALADDSGICVDALGGLPGIHSARFAGEPRADLRNNAKLLDAMDGTVDRRAHYYCVLVLVRHPEDPQPLIAEGEWFGEILTAPCGEAGFGYDPLFWVPEYGCSAAELSAEQKNRLSHRGRALAALQARLR